MAAVAVAPVPCTRRACRFRRKLLSQLSDLRRSASFCDVVVTAGQVHFQVHRAVLCASSAYFNAMFNGSMMERQQNVVHIHGVSALLLSTLLDFIYTGEVSISEDNVQQLIVAADMLQLTDVVDSCSAFLIQQLHPSNAIGIFRFSEANNLWCVCRAARAFINQHFAACVACDEFVDVPYQLLCQLIDSEQLHIDSEHQVFEAVLRWIVHRVDERRRHVFDVLSLVRLPLVAGKRIEHSIGQCSDNSLKVALRSVKRDMDEQAGGLVRLRAVPRTGAKKSVFVVGGSHKQLASTWTRSETVLSSLECFDTFNKTWRQCASMRFARILPGVAVLNGRIYVVGGEQDSLIMANGEVYDPQEDKWAGIACMVSPRVEFGLAAVDGQLYAIGGWVGVDIGGTVEQYDPLTDQWTLAAVMPLPRFSMGVATHHDVIYLVGGCTLIQRHLSDVVSFQPSTGRWRHLCSMTTARSQLGVAVLDDWLYAVGGIDRNNAVLCVVERYHLQRDEWQSVRPMQVARASPCVAAVDGRLYVIGGDQHRRLSDFYRAEVTVNTVEVFDPGTGQWSEGVSLTESRSEAGVAVF